MNLLRAAAVAALTLCACGAAEESAPAADEGFTCTTGHHAFADVVVDAPGTVDAQFSIEEPCNAVNGVVEGASQQGGLDVFSRGLSTDPPNNYLVLRWSDRKVVDAEGPDIVIFENAFQIASTEGVFMDLIVVEVSNDLERWVAFDHDFVAEDETRYSVNPKDWPGFAGRTPSAWSSDSGTDPFAADAGGDAFDLADLDDPELSNGFTYLRLTAAPTVINPDTGEPFVKDFISDGFDLAGVFARQTD